MTCLKCGKDYYDGNVCPHCGAERCEQRYWHQYREQTDNWSFLDKPTSFERKNSGLSDIRIMSYILIGLVILFFVFK